MFINETSKARSFATRQKVKTDKKLKIEQEEQEMIRSIKKFIKNKPIQNNNKTYIKYRCCGCDKECLVSTNIENVNKTCYAPLEIFKSEIIRTCKIKLVDN